LKESVWQDSFLHMCDMCDMTHSSMCDMCDMTHSFICVTCVTWLIQVCVTCATWLIPSYVLHVWHDSFNTQTRTITHMKASCHVSVRVMLHIWTYDYEDMTIPMTPSYVQHDSMKIWLEQTRDMIASYVW